MASKQQQRWVKAIPEFGVTFFDTFAIWTQKYFAFMTKP